MNELVAKNEIEIFEVKMTEVGDVVASEVGERFRVRRESVFG